MDITKTINNILYTLEHYPVPEDLEWSTEQVLTLISRIKELEAINKKACIELVDSASDLEKAEVKVKKLQEGIERHKAACHNISCGFGQFYSFLQRPYIFCEPDRKLYELLEGEKDEV
jgi:hypothetical protein